MAAKTRKRNVEWQEFKKWKNSRNLIRAQYKFAEAYHRNVFEIFKKCWNNGEIRSLRDMKDFDIKYTVNSMRMMLDSIDGLDEWMREIPAIHFKEEWGVKVLPGTNGAVSRMFINDKVSIYLDVYDRLGIMNEPYWEIYDGKETDRFPMNDIEGLIAAINKIVSFNELPKETREFIEEMEKEFEAGE